MQNRQDAHIIVFGNAADGAGKTLTAAACAIELLRDGYRVGTLDLDGETESLSLFLHRRREHDAKLPQPVHHRFTPRGTDEKSLQNSLMIALTELGMECDVIVIDTPHADKGGDQPIARLAHGYADTLVTPLREGDLRTLATFKNKTSRIDKPTAYSEMVEEQNIRKIDRNARPIHWLVLRSLTAPGSLKAKRQSPDLFDKLSSHLGFAPLTALHERPLYKDLFDKGLTVCDLTTTPDLSTVAARQEIRTLVHAIAPATATAVKNAL